MSFPTVNGMLNENEETSRSPMGAKRGQCSGCALRVMIVQNEVEVGIDPSALEKTEDVRKRESVEQRVGVDEVGLGASELVAKKRLCLVACAEGNPSLVETDGKYAKYRRASLRLLEFSLLVHSSVNSLIYFIMLLPSEEHEANLLPEQSEDFTEHLYYGQYNKLFVSSLISIQLGRLCGRRRV